MIHANQKDALVESLRAAGKFSAGAYDNIISRSDTQALVPEEVSNAMLTSLESMSAVLNMFPRIPISRKSQRFPVLAALPTAYFVNGDTGLKQTTEMGWTNKFMEVEELAAIVPIPEAVLDDTSFDIWGSIQPLLEQAIGRALDAAIFFGDNKPASWPDALVPEAISRGKFVTRGTNNAAAGGLSQDFSDLFAKREDDGYDASGMIAGRTLKGPLRSVRNTQGEGQSNQVSQNNVWGVTPMYPMRGMWPTGSGVAEALVGDFQEGIVGIRQDMTYKVLDQAVIQNNQGEIVFNLAQQDMVALRVVFRPAFQIKNTINWDNPDEEERYPWAVLKRP